MLNVGRQCFAEKPAESQIDFYVSILWIPCSSASAAPICSCQCSDRSPSSTLVAALRLNDTLTSLQPVCIRSTPPPPRRRSRRSRPLKHTLCKQLRLRTFQPKLRRVWKKQCPFWFCLSNNRRGRARYNNRPWHYAQSSHSSSAFLGQMKRLARRNGFPQPVTLIRRCFNCLGRERHMYLIIYLLFNHIRLTLLSFVQMAAWEQGFTTSYISPRKS